MRNKALVLVLPVAIFFLALPGVAAAASFTVLHSFGGPEGETPAAPLVQGADGSLYGVAAHGGDFTAMQDGGGTAFRVDASGTVTTLHTFTGPDGAVPRSLIQGRDGFFYGTTTYGGGDVSPLPSTGVRWERSEQAPSAATSTASIRSPATSATCMTSSAATAQSPPGRSSRPATASSTGRPTRAARGTRA
jgi:uncharacterized repeat protein (TIGR03803 family)